MMKKKIVGREKTIIFKNVYQKAEIAIADLVAKGYTIVDVQGKDGSIFTQTLTTSIINMFRGFLNKEDIKDVVITIYYE